MVIYRRISQSTEQNFPRDRIFDRRANHLFKMVLTVRRQSTSVTLLLVILDDCQFEFCVYSILRHVATLVLPVFIFGIQNRPNVMEQKNIDVYAFAHCLF